MTGVDIVGALLRESSEMTAMIPEERIKAGVLPANIALSALLLRQISGVDRQPLKRGVFTRVTDRVAVTVRASNYRDQRAAMKLVRKICAGRIGNIGGGTRVAILTAGLGPDVAGPADSFEQTQDFKVSYDATA